MRILAIRGENLASLYGPFEIVLGSGPIAEAGLFSISGPTGSGKSTLVDALCLALYGRTPRLGERGRGVMVGLPGDDPSLRVEASDERDLVSRGTGGGHAEVDFEGVDGKRYRARWSVHRARNRPGGKLQPVRVAVTGLDGDEPLAGTVRERDEVVPRLLGYSFDEFRRAVVLPQFEFTNFLKAGADERAAILERVTGTGVYSLLSVAAFRRAAEETARLEEQRRRLGEVGLLPEEERRQLEEREAEAARGEASARASAAAADEAVRWHEAEARNAAGVALAEEALSRARAEREQAAPLRAELVESERAERLRPARDAAERTARDHALARERKEAAADGCRAAADAVAGAGAAEAQAAAAATAAVEAQLAARPAIQRARALDAAAADALRRSGAAREDRLRADEEARAAAEQARGALAAVAALEARREAAGAWLRDHRAEEPLAAQWPRWQADLAEHARIVADLGREEEATAAAGRRLDEARRRREGATAAVVRVDAELGPLEARARQAEAASAPDDLPGLQRAQGDGTARRDSLRELAALCAEAARARAARDLADGEAREAEQAVQAVEREVARNGRELQAAASALAAARSALQLTVATLRLEEHRDALVDGEPCPLCGALEHPYAREAPGDTLRRRQEEVVGGHERSVDALREAGVELQRRGSRAGERARAAREARDRHQASLAALEERYAAAREARPVEGVPPLADGSGEELARLLAGAEAALAASQAELQGAIARREEAERDRRLVESRREERERARAALVEAERAAERAGAEVARTAERVDGLALRRDGLESSLEPVLSFRGAWREEARRDPAGFARTCAGVAEAHAARGREAGEAEDRLGPARRAAEAARVREEEKRRTADGAAARERTVGEELEGLRAERAPLLGGAPAEEAERRLDEALREARERHAGAQARTAAASREAARREQEAADAGARLEEAASRAAAEEAALARSLAAHGLDRPTLARLLGKGAGWLEEAQAALRRLDDSLVEAEATCADRVRHAEAHRASGRPSLSPEEAVRQAAQAVETARAAHARLVELQLRLQGDAAARERAAALGRECQAQEAVARRWRALSDLVGSADGKKLRAFAQGLTLDALLQRANHRLRELAPRYGLMRVPGQDLELQVVDHDLGDEVRSVNGLSGGESFLVSLALALALASVATRVAQSRTLLIDEGFGTLDRDTLEHALVALEGLQASGRTVGVISHVPELHDRIGVRVDVVRTGPGRSRVVGPE